MKKEQKISEFMKKQVEEQKIAKRKEKIREALKQQGIRIKAVGLTEKERKIIEEAMRKIKYGRKKGNCPSLPYLMELK